VRGGYPRLNDDEPHKKSFKNKKQSRHHIILLEMGMIKDTYTGGLLAHMITIFPYLFGSAVFLAPAGLVARGNKNATTTAVLCSIAGITSLQYIITVQKWPAFRDWFISLGPRSYFKRCTLGGNLKDIKDEKVILTNQHPPPPEIFSCSVFHVNCVGNILCWMYWSSLFFFLFSNCIS
jgi:hypothetical protein